MHWSCCCRSTKLEEINNERNQIKEVWPEDISSALKNQIYGQDRAIDALAEGIATNYMRNSEKVYVALLLGPPATGKQKQVSCYQKFYLNCTEEIMALSKLTAIHIKENILYIVFLVLLLAM